MVGNRITAHRQPILAIKTHLSENRSTEGVVNHVVQSILEHLGGMGDLGLFIGAGDYVDHGHAVSFKFRAGLNHNYCKATYDNTTRTYELEVCQVYVCDDGTLKIKRKNHNKATGLELEDLEGVFEHLTGVCVHPKLA